MVQLSRAIYPMCVAIVVGATSSGGFLVTISDGMCDGCSGMMASQVTDCFTSKPLAVVAPCRRVAHSSDPELVDGRSLTTSKCDDTTERGQRQPVAASVPTGHDSVSGDRRRCSENTEDAARSSKVAVDRQSAAPPDVDDLSTCPFYHGNITSDEAKRRLADKACGTFLLRDSQSTNFPLSLSVRTSGQSGVTSLRIARVADRFRLDSPDAHRSLMPTFDSVLKLVRHFVAKSDGGQGGRCVLVGASGCREQPLDLRQPLYWPITDN